MTDRYGDGNVVSFVSEDRPAGHVGIRVGDRVLSVSGAPIHGRRDIDRLLRPRVANGLLVMLYLVLGLVAAVHSYLKATRSHRSEWGLNVMLAGLAVGILPILIIDLVVLALGIEHGGMEFAFVPLALVPISMAFAAVRAEKSRPEGA
jgi:hypothetical protein